MHDIEQFSQVFRKLQPKFSRFYDRMLAKADLTLPQYNVLTELEHASSDPLTMTEISERLHITKPAVTSLADRLEQTKFLKRINHPTDRRISLLEIQPKGKRVVQSVQSQALDLLVVNIKQFNERERKIIMRFYELIGSSLDRFLNEPGSAK
jgi:DNA-binding MarR family transcriptional regulator